MARGSITDVEGLVSAGFTWAVETAHEVDRSKFAWFFVPQFPLVSATKRVQVRDIEELAPKLEVTEYAEQMKLGAEFPPIVVTRDGWLVDGHTRNEAAKRVKWDSISAIVLQVNWEDIAPADRERVLTLGGAFNKKHGRRMSPRNIAALIEQVAAGNMDSPKEIARKMYVKPSTAVTVVNAARATRKARALSIPILNTLNNSSLKFFGGKLERYTDPVWGAFFSLAQDAKLSTEEMNELAHRIEAVGSEAERLAILQTERGQRRTTITSGVRAMPNKASRVRQGLGFLLAEVNTPEILVETDPVKGPEYLVRLTDARKKIDAVIVEQEKVEHNR